MKTQVNMTNQILQGGRGRGGGRGLGRGASRGLRRGGGNKPVSGPGGYCICPTCGHKEPHVTGRRCLDQVCPKCGKK